MADDAVLRALDILTPVFETSGLEQLEVEAGEIQVRLARAVAPSTAAPLSAAAPAPPLAATPPTSVSPFGEPAPGRRFVTAPLTGVWYGAPSPGARPYLAVDAEVSVGQVVGLIEAMKLFNEIKSDIAGKVTRILVESGTLVKRQQPILEVDPS